MDSLLPLAQKVGEKLKARKETIGISESSAGGLVSAALLAVPGASAYFMGGAVVYTRPAGDAFLAVPREKRLYISTDAARGMSRIARHALMVLPRPTSSASSTPCCGGVFSANSAASI